MSIDITAIIGTAIGLAGFGFGIFSYFRNELERRKQTIFPLIEEFNNDKKLFVAKSLLDNYSFNRKLLARLSPMQDFNVRDMSPIETESIMAEGNIGEYVNPPDLAYVLRDHRSPNANVTAPEEIAIRMSFDYFLDFFVKLEYLLSMDLVKNSELEYFNYYIKKTTQCPILVSYMNNYEFPLKGKLDPYLKAA